MLLTKNRHTDLRVLRKGNRVYPRIILVFIDKENHQCNSGMNLKKRGK